MRRIDADKLKEHYSWWEGGSLEITLDKAKRDFDTIVDLQPTAERRGHWTDRGSLSCRCSECGCKSPREFKFCPNCGAHMED